MGYRWKERWRGEDWMSLGRGPSLGLKRARLGHRYKKFEGSASPKARLGHPWRGPLTGLEMREERD